MKRLIAVILLASLLLTGLAGCKKENPDSEGSDVSGAVSELPPVAESSQTASLSFEDRITEDPSLTAKGDPPLTKDLQLLYEDAQEMVRAFTLCNFQTAGSLTAQIDGMTFLVITDPRFPTYEALQTYLKRLFTDDYIYSHLLTADSCVRQNGDGLPCVLEAAGSENACYAGHVFTVDSRTADKITLTATVYYTEEPSTTGDYFFQTPDKESDYTTETMHFTIVYTQDGWRFSEFAFVRG